jgi:hypothetical protein
MCSVNFLSCSKVCATNAQVWSNTYLKMSAMTEDFCSYKVITAILITSAMKMKSMNRGTRQSHCVSVINIILNLVAPAVQMLSHNSILFGLSAKFSPLCIEPNTSAWSDTEKCFN